MDNRALAALLSSLISELLLLLLVISPPSHSDSFPSLSPLLIHFISTSQTAASFSFLSSRKRKRKRTHVSESDAPADETSPVSKLGRRLGELGRFDSAIPRDPDSFKLCFKMTSSTFEWLSTLLEPLLECRDPVDSPLNLSAETRLGIGLFRLATGSDYREVSSRFGVSEPVAKFCVKQFCRVLCTNFRFWIGFPNPNELGPLSDSFETLTGLPNCCGVVHCTRFKILKNGSAEDEESVAAQIVVDSSSRILSIVAGFSGKKGISLVLKSSSLYKDIEANNLLNSPPIDINGVSIPQYLVGDERYPLLPWLMVPFSQPWNSDEERFNSVHNVMLFSGFRTIESLKNWGVLSRPIKEDVKTVVAYIGACSILHNALLMREDYSALSEKSDDYSQFSESSQSCSNVRFEENIVEHKASEIRGVLATRARRC